MCKFNKSGISPLGCIAGYLFQWPYSWAVPAPDIVPWLDVADDLDFAGQERTTEQEVTELRQAVGLDESLDLEDCCRRNVEGQWNTHRRADEQRVLCHSQRLERVHANAFLESVDQLRTSANGCSDKTSSSLSSSTDL